MMDFNRKYWHVFLSWFLTAHIIWLHECIKSFLVSHSCMGCPIFRSSRPEVFCRLCNFIKKATLAQVFSCEFCEISKNTFSYRSPRVAASVYIYFCQYYHKRNSAEREVLSFESKFSNNLAFSLLLVLSREILLLLPKPHGECL